MKGQVMKKNCKRFLKAVLLAAIVAVVMSGADAQETKSESKTAPVSEKPASGQNATQVDPDYVIGSEDVLMINVWREPEMSRTVSVRPDGKITLPLIGDFEAAGSTPRQLQERLSKKLQTLVTNPEVSVSVQEIRSQRFNVIGEVGHPGTFPLSKSMTILDAIALSGGFKDYAKPNKMYVLRRSPDGKTVKIAVNYKKVVRGEAPEQNIELETRDTIVVP
jgi:polysaccharide export outer membrane protein